MEESRLAVDWKANGEFFLAQNDVTTKPAETFKLCTPPSDTAGPDETPLSSILSGYWTKIPSQPVIR